MKDFLQSEHGMMQLPDSRWFTAAAARHYVIPNHVKTLVATLPVSCVKPKASPGAQNRQVKKLVVKALKQKDLATFGSLSDINCDFRILLINSVLFGSSTFTSRVCQYTAAFARVAWSCLSCPV